MKGIVVSLGFLSLAYSVNVPGIVPFAETTCETNPEGNYCVTQKQYLSCTDNVLHLCPLDGQYCSDVAGGCATDETVAPKTNATKCNKCLTPTGTSCVSPTSYVPCVDKVPDETVTPTICSDGFFCDADDSTSGNPCKPFTLQVQLCWNTNSQAPGTGEPSTESPSSGPTSESPPSTTQSIVEMDDAFCAGKTEPGRYKPPLTTDCTQFVICENPTPGAPLYSIRSTCPNKYNFNPDTKKCLPPTIYSCPATPA